AIDVSPDYSIAGAFFDGDYNLVFERDVDVSGVVEVFVQSYPTLGDLMGDTNGTGSFSAIDVNPDYSIRGAFDISSNGGTGGAGGGSGMPPRTGAVPEPSIGLLLLAGLVSLGLSNIPRRSHRI
ncbi:MAG TPA: PEP-CTERM sorting domain-containing protein, partial [Gammaproteobacteria bacterium]|nr:PEP-CTERM sorting domain-containing protein [Gammaproteobacteria bacterium]